MTHVLLAGLLAACTIAIGASAAKADPEAPLTSPLGQSVLARVAFLGDSITDGNTYPQLVRDSLATSAGIHMVAMNAGIGGNTMPQMSDRLDRDVLDHHPTLVTISAGANDAVKGVTAAQYEAAMRSVVARLAARNIPVLLLTPCWWPSSAVGHPSQEAYDGVIRRIAAEYGLRVAEVTRQMASDAAAGQREHSLDGHPGYTGQRSMARAVLDAMGYPDVPVIDRVRAVIDDGVILDWRIRPLATTDTTLTDDAIAAMTPDSTWANAHLPFAKIDLTDSDFESLGWLDDVRQEGMATQLNKNIGPGVRFVSISTVDARRARKAVLQSGAEVQSVWLNGRKVLGNDGTHGWHIGRDAVPIELKAGSNTVTVLSGANFWLRIGRKPIW